MCQHHHIDMHDWQAPVREGFGKHAGVSAKTLTAWACASNITLACMTGRHLPEKTGSGSMLESLPPDIPVCAGLEEFDVGDSYPDNPDSRKELGLRTDSETTVGEGSILGVYRGFVCYANDFNQRWKCEPYIEWQPRLLSEYVFRMNVYAADINRPDPNSEYKACVADFWSKLPPVSFVVVSESNCAWPILIVHHLPKHGQLFDLSTTAVVTCLARASTTRLLADTQSQQ